MVRGVLGDIVKFLLQFMKAPEGIVKVRISRVKRDFEGTE